MADDDGKIRERIAVLEANHYHMATQIDSMEKKLTEVHTVLIEARGWRSLLIAGAVVIGVLIGSVKPLLQWIGWAK